MEQIDEPKVAFAFLRPACVLLTREQTAANARRLAEQLRLVSDGALQQLQEYVLFPLRFVLKTPAPKTESLAQAAVEVVAYVLSRTCVRSWDVLRELFSELCLCLCSPADPGRPAESSEELKAAALRGLLALVHAAYGDVVWRLYEPAMLPGLGTAVSLLLALAERERAREVQAAALKCLQALLQRCDCPEEHVTVGPEEERALGAAFASFLPGIALALSRVVAGDVRQGHEVTARAVRVWYGTVGLVLADDQLTDPGAPEQPSAELGRVGQLVVRRTADWVKETSGKLAVILKRIISWISAHQHWRVRLEVVSLSDHLLTTSRGSLGECVGPLLDALVTMVNDEDPVVRDKCGAALENVAWMSREHGGQAFADVLSENLHSLATSLPRLMRTSDDRRKLAVLGAFLGYLKILGPGVEGVLNSASHLHRVSRALMQVLELDVSDVRIVEERGAADPVGGGAGETPVRKKKHFLYFTDEKVFSMLREVCRLLGYYGNLYLLVDHFLDLYRESSAYRKQAAIALNEVIAGAAGVGVDATRGHVPVSRDDLNAAVTSVIEEYTSLDNWHLPTSSEDSDQGEQLHFGQPAMLSIANRAEGELNQLPSARKGSTVHQLNSNIWQICIQLEGVGCMALAMGTDFQPLLITTLYPVLEKAAERTLLIGQSALAAMLDVARACGYGSLKELVVGNSDYLLNDVALNLQRLGLHPHGPRVLAVMLAHADADLLPLVRDVVRDVLAALDQNYDERADVFCAVLHSLLKALVRWFPVGAGVRKAPPGPAGAKRAEPCWEETLDVRQFLLDYRREKQLAEGIVGDDEDAEDTEVPLCAEESDVDMGSPDEKAELPSHIAITKEVMERCVHLLSYPSLPIRLKVLDVLELCVLVLHAHTNELLPLVHQCWPALLQRLTNDDPLAVLRAFRVLCTLGETCGDFLRKRVSKEVLPKLTGSLRRQAPVSAKAGPIYTHTLAYKLQAAVLQGLGSLCLRLDLVDTDLESVSEACLPYLSSRQPPKLQEACISVFQHLIQVDPDAMWLTLNELHCPLTYEPPHPDLHPITLAGMGQPRTEYTDNVLKLLEDVS
ncbi:TELO2-interacting protein 1 homolog [Anguilla rostrata]|uniref:TELO2-interacting protein 1 homolog n=1 Tax=Anguilla rostrata TaxID=7938 RepID=UPI0030CAB789